MVHLRIVRNETTVRPPQDCATSGFCDFILESLLGNSKTLKNVRKRSKTRSKMLENVLNVRNVKKCPNIFPQPPSRTQAAAAAAAVPLPQPVKLYFAQCTICAMYSEMPLNLFGKAVICEAACSHTVARKCRNFGPSALTVARKY